MLGPQPGLHRLRYVRTLQEPLIGRLRFLFINALGLSVLLLPPQQLERRLEMIGEPAPLVGLQVVHQRRQLGLPKALVAEKLPHVRPVLLLAVGVVVLAVGPAAQSRVFSRLCPSNAGARPS